MKNLINSFSLDLWLSNLTEGWLTIRSQMSNKKVTYPSDHVVMWDHVINELHYVFILRSLLPLNMAGWWLVKWKSRYDGLTNVWLVFRFLSKFWLNWKKFSSEDTLFLKHFYFSISFTNFLINTCLGQAVFKYSGSQSGKNISDQHYGKIPDQEFKSWFTKYFKLKIKDESW